MSWAYVGFFMNKKVDCAKQRKLYAAVSVAAIVLYSLLCFVLNPIGEALLADIAYENSIFVAIIDYLGTVVDLAAVVLFYAVLIYALYCFGSNKIRGGVAAFVGCVVYKYAASAIADWVQNGSIPRDWHMYVFNIVFYTVLESLQLLIVLMISNRFIGPFRAKNALLRTAGEEEISVYPFTGVYDKKNPLMKSALVSAIVIFVSKAIVPPVNDIIFISVDGLPTSFETVKNMLIFYLENTLFSLVYGLLCYIAVVFTLMKLLEYFERKNS